MQESRRNEAKQEQIGIGTSVTVLRNGIYRLEEGWQVADVIIGGDGQTYYVVHSKDGKYQKTVPEKLLHMWQKAYRVKRSSGDREDGWVVGDFSVGNDGEIYYKMFSPDGKYTKTVSAEQLHKWQQPTFSEKLGAAIRKAAKFLGLFRNE